MELNFRGIKAVVTLFGYRDHRYVEAEFPRYGEKFYYSVSNEFAISDIDHFEVEWRDPYLCEGLQAMNMVFDHETKSPIREYDLPFPVGDYSFVDDILEIGESAGMEFSTDDADLEEIKEFVEKIKKKVDKHQRLLEILDDTPVVTLAKTIDKGNELIDALNKTITTINGHVAVLEKQLKETRDKFSAAEKKIGELEKENQTLKLERVTLKEELISKLKESISKI